MKSFFKIFCFLMLFVASTFTTSFAQFPWTKDASNPVMSGGSSGTWNNLVMMPNVLYNSDSSRYEMWYAGSPGAPLRPYRIGFATSTDGISWTKHSGAVLTPTAGSWDESTVEGPMVLRENGQYKMWYTGWSPTDGGIGYATSPDGINWTKDTLNNPVMGPGTAIWELGDPAYCSVLPLQGGIYKMWYSGFNTNYSEANVGYATSVDGINWQKDTLNNPVLTIGITGQWDNPMILIPKVISINSLYHMWYTGLQSSTFMRKIGWATSADGILWTKYNDPTTTGTLYADSDPVLSASAGQWDGDRVETGTVMLEGDSLRMWYSGWISNNPISIGHATAPINIDGISVLNKNLPYEYILNQNYPNPFNPSTTIEFSIPKTEFVTLKIYNLLGQEVATLVSDNLNAGNHKYTWDASPASGGQGFASGVYLYKIEAGSYVQTRKLILMK